MKQINILEEVPKGFAGELEIYNLSSVTDRKTKKRKKREILFSITKIKEPLKEGISVYIFLFKAMENQFKDQPQLKMHKFGEIFANAMEVSGKEKTEKQIKDTFGNKFSFKLR